jgi:hypothetical protein
MNMEHRLSKRRRVCLEALIFHRVSGLVPVNILDISLEGAFIGAERIALPPHALVTLTFALDTVAKPSIRQTEALVIHRARNGCGLLLKEVQLETFQAIDDIRNAA